MDYKKHQTQSSNRENLEQIKQNAMILDAIDAQENAFIADDIVIRLVPVLPAIST